MSVSEGMSQFLDGAATEAEALSDLVLADGMSPRAAEDDQAAWWVRDRDFFQRELGTFEPSSWIQSTAGWYLAEAAHQLRAIASLLRSRTITGSLGPLTRAIVERIGVNAWILDVEQADSMERGWRAMLNALVCGSEYRKMVDLLRAPSKTRKDLAKEYRELRAGVRTWFSPDVDEELPDDVSLWTRSGLGYPDFTDVAVMGMSGEFDEKVRRGLYAAQCGMTHPNIFVLGETIAPIPGADLGFVHPATDVDKEVRVAFVTFMRGLMVWSRYFSIESEFDVLQSRIKEISSRFEAASPVSEAEPEEDESSP